MLMGSQEKMAGKGNLDPRESLLELVLRVIVAWMEIVVSPALRVREVPQVSQV